MSSDFWNTLPRPILALAPMVGITDSAYRRLAKHWGADVVYSEMIAAEALVRHVPKAFKMMEFVAAEQPVVIQIMGNNPKVIAEAAKIVEASGAAGLDLNFGCPANKIARNFCGVMLMRDLVLSRQIIEAALSAVTVPVSVKVRTAIYQTADLPAGRPRDKVSVLDFINANQDLPLAAVMIHGRSFEGSFTGPIDTAIIKQAKTFFSGPILANGGVTTIESAREVLAATKADGLGLARSVIGQPWVFRQVKDYLTTGSYKPVSWEEIKQTMQQHADWFYELYGPKYFQPIRHHLAHYIKGQTNASQLRQRLVRVNSPEEVRKILAEINIPSA
ncbi:MAG: tRNA-dihydrouridine synthase [Candidatus Komeilibacteria bacterium]